MPPASPSLTRAQREVAAAKERHVRSRMKARDELCVDPVYPGKPSDYTFVGAHCVKKGTANPRKAAASTKEGTGIPAAQTQREIKVLQKAIDAYGKDHGDWNIVGTNIERMTEAFQYMISRKKRREQPDPLKRYDDYLELVAHAGKKRDFVVPRFTVLKLTLAAMRERA